MTKIFQQIDLAIKRLLDLETSDLDRSDPARVIRRDLELIYADYLKQGLRIPVVKPFELFCPKCNFVPLNEEVLYVHLRKKHKMDDSDATKNSTTQRQDYDQDIENLKDLLRKYTEYLLEETPQRGN